MHRLSDDEQFLLQTMLKIADLYNGKVGDCSFAESNITANTANDMMRLMWRLQAENQRLSNMLGRQVNRNLFKRAKELDANRRRQRMGNFCRRLYDRVKQK